MSERKNGDISKQEQYLRSLLKSAVQSEEYQNLKAQVRKGAHPARDILYGYVTGDLNDQDAGIVRKHLLFCEICTDEVARLMRIEQHVDEELEKWGEQPGPVSVLKLPGVLATEVWEPLLEETAAVAHEQAHTFAVGDGEISLFCSWQGEYRDKPPFIRLEWKADISVRSEIWVHFAAQQEEAEFCLGTALSGEDSFTSKDLGFDPSTEPWKVAFALKEVESSTKAELLEEIATEYWTPQWAGEQLTAADMTEQEYTFALQEGEITLKCHWQGEHDDEPAYIRLTWEAHIEKERELWARFVTDGTQEVLSEVPLGTDLSGKKIFTRQVLEFNPATKPWAVALVLRPVKP